MFGRKEGQTAVEYMLLLAMVVSLVLVGFRKYLPRIHEASNVYFNRVGEGIYGTPSRCGDGVQGPYETCENCPIDAGTCAG